MQLYNFRCDTCDHRFEAWDNMEKSADIPCPSCDTPGAVRLISKPRLDYVNMAVPLSGGADGMTTAVDRWAKAREEKRKIQQHNYDTHGTWD